MSDETTLARELRHLTAQVEEAKVEHDGVLAAINKSKEERDQLNAEINRLVNTVEARKILIDDYDGVKLEKEKRLEVLHQEEAVLAETVKNLKADHKILEGDIDLLQKQAADNAEKRLSDAEKAISSLRSEASAAERGLQTATKKKDQIVGDITTLEKKYAGLVDQHGALTAIIQKLQGEYEHWQGGVTRKNDEIRVLSESIASLVEEKKILTTERDALVVEKGIVENENAVLMKEQKKLTQDTAVKRDEYEAAAVALMNIATRRDELDQREVFLKEQYQKIGINWE